MFIRNCALCGYPPEIIDDRGIGDIRCSNPNCENNHPTRFIENTNYKMSRYHFSGKFNTSKKDVIKEWNHDQSIGLMIPQ